MSKHPSCLVGGCPGRMDGQMISCAPHWSLLTRPLRDSIALAWDTLELERREGNPRRASRDLVRSLEAAAKAEWADILVTILPNMVLGYTPNGLVWKRTLNLMQAEATAEPSLNAPPSIEPQ